MSEERDYKAVRPASDEPETEQDDVEAHQKAIRPMDSTSNDDGDDVEAHVKRGHGSD